MREIGGDDNIADALTNKIEIKPEEIPNEFSFKSALDSDCEEIWEEICRAIWDRKIIKAFTQNAIPLNQKSVLSIRIIWRISGDWYLFGRSHDRDKILQFAIGRFKLVEITADKFVFPKSFSVEQLMENTFGRFASMEEMTEISVLIKKDAAQDVEDRIWHKKQKIVRRENGDIEISFPVSASGNQPFYNVKEWILSKGKFAKVLKPELLKKIVAAEILEMAKLIENDE